jgi:SAM-dependent methyltransferase
MLSTLRWNEDVFLNNEEKLVWEETRCDWCGSSSYDIIFKGPDRLKKLPGLFSVVRCKSCGIYRQNPRLSWYSLKSYYPDDYFAHTIIPSDSNNPIKIFFRQYGNWKRVRAIEKFQSGGRLLEVGCGTGGFLRQVCSHEQWSAVGIEPSSWAASYAQKNLDIPVYVGRFSEVDLELESFDVIVFWCVLEHLDQPFDDLRYANSLLKNNGLLVFSIPNLNSLDLKIFRKYWSGWDLPRHLYLFPRRRLSKILEDIGFNVISERCLANSYADLGVSIEFWSQKWEEKYPGLKSLLMAFYHFWFVRAVVAFPITILDRLGLSTNITVFAQKRA